MVRGPLTAVVVVALLAAAFIWLIKEMENDPELANKPEWSALQSAEQKYSDPNNENRLLLVKAKDTTEYDLIGIRQTKYDFRVWIMAYPRNSPKIKIMPQNIPIRISKTEFAQIKSELILGVETEMFLSNSIEE